MILLYPCEPFELTKVDAAFAEEYELFMLAGYDVRLMNFEDILFRKPLKVYPKIEEGSFVPVLYRGWMLNAGQYARYCRQLRMLGGSPVVGSTAYSETHWLPGWYDKLQEVTASSTFIFRSEYRTFEDLKLWLDELDWSEPKFIKDFVKSNTDKSGSVAYCANEAMAILCELETHRGSLEGGVSLRDFKHFASGSEKRFFVINGIPYSPNNKEVPEVVTLAAQRIESPFFSVDVATRIDGVVEIVELGDGQVSDIKEWPLLNFATIITNLIEELKA